MLISNLSNNLPLTFQNFEKFRKIASIFFSVYSKNNFYILFQKTRRIHINRNPNERPGQFATDRGHAHDRFIQEVINPSEPNLAEKHPRKFFKILEQKLRPIADKRLQDERLVGIN